MIGRRIAAGAFAVSIVAGLAALVARVSQEVIIDVEHGFESAFVEGFHPRERAGETYFRWTRDQSFLVLDNLYPSGDVDVEARLRVIRSSEMPLPNLAFTANGVTVHREIGKPGEAIYAFDFPSTSSRLRLGIESDTFEAGGGRFLGVQVLSVRIVPPGGRAAARNVIAWLALATMFFVLGASWVGLGPWTAALAGGAMGAAFCWLVSLRSLAFSSYPREVAMFALVSVGLIAIVSALLQGLTSCTPRERRSVLAVVALAFVIKLGALSCPLWLSSDAEFQANRFSQFLAGDWYPSSVTQHETPFRIPYPVSLFAVSTPLTWLGVDRIAALESVIVGFDALAGAALVLVALRFRGDLRAGALAALVYHSVPVSVLALSAGNFTNVFALSTLVLGFSCLAASDGTENRMLSFGAGVFAFISLCAHFGMLLEGGLLWPAWITALILLVPTSHMGNPRSVQTVAVGAALVAGGVYYLGYAPLVVDQWQRALGGGESGSGAGLVAGLASSASFLREQIGWVALLAALAGGVTFLRKQWFSSVLHAGITVWIAVTALFFVLDLLTPLEIRYAYQAVPVIALLAGLYLSNAFARGGVGRFAAVSAVVYLSVVALRGVVEATLVRYH